MTVTRMIATEGTSNAGANVKICGRYISDISDVIPVENTPFSSISHKVLTLLERWDSSPDEYWRKNLGGNDMIRIMTAASTEISVFT